MSLMGGAGPGRPWVQTPMGAPGRQESSAQQWRLISRLNNSLSVWGSPDWFLYGHHQPGQEGVAQVWQGTWGARGHPCCLVGLGPFPAGDKGHRLGNSHRPGWTWTRGLQTRAGTGGQGGETGTQRGASGSSESHSRGVLSTGRREGAISWRFPGRGRRSGDPSFHPVISSTLGKLGIGLLPFGKLLFILQGSSS